MLQKSPIRDFCSSLYGVNHQFYMVNHQVIIVVNHGFSYGKSPVHTVGGTKKTAHPSVLLVQRSKCLLIEISNSMKRLVDSAHCTGDLSTQPWVKIKWIHLSTYISIYLYNLTKVFWILKLYNYFFLLNMRISKRLNLVGSVSFSQFLAQSWSSRETTSNQKEIQEQLIKQNFQVSHLGD